MPIHTIDATVLVFLGVILVAFQRVGLAAIVGGIGLWLFMRTM
jgi:hypothetical protein